MNFLSHTVIRIMDAEVIEINVNDKRLVINLNLYSFRVSLCLQGIFKTSVGLTFNVVLHVHKLD